MCPPLLATLRGAGKRRKSRQVYENSGAVTSLVRPRAAASGGYSQATAVSGPLIVTCGTFAAVIEAGSRERINAAVATGLLDEISAGSPFSSDRNAA